MTGVILGSPSGTLTPVLFAPAGADPAQVVVGMRVVSAGGEFDLLQGVQLQATTGLTGGDAEEELFELHGVDGAFVRGESDPRAGLILRPLQVMLSVLVTAETGMAAEARVSELWRLLSVRLHGPARIELTLGTGQVRWLPVRHLPKTGDRDPTWGTEVRARLVLLRFSAPSPLWRGRPGRAGPWVLGGGGGLGLPLGVPLGLARSTILGSANPLVVEGEEETYPLLTFTGPSAGISVEADGRGWTLDRTLTAGQTILVNHSPTAAQRGGQVVGPAGEDWSEYLDDGADLFELRPGTTRLTVTMTGTSAASSGAASWEAYYWSGIG